MSGKRLGEDRPHRAAAARPASSPTCCAAAALPDAVPVPRPQDAAGHHPAGRDRLRLRARRRSRCRRPRRSPPTPRASDFQDAARLPRDRRPEGPAAQDPARRHLRDQPRAVRRDHRRPASTTCRSTAARTTRVRPDGAADRRARRLPPGRHHGRRRPHRRRHRPRRPGRCPQGEIIAPIVGDDPAHADDVPQQLPGRRSKFLAAGGQRGRQLQVLVEGTYYINRLFATDRAGARRPSSRSAPSASSSRYTGDAGARPLGRGLQARRAGRPAASAACGASRCCPASTRSTPTPARSIMVPTTNFILKWNRSETGAHKFDENLSEVTLITKDAFEPTLPLSVVVHIDYRKAPLVVQRFGDIKRLVEQTLDPMVARLLQERRPDAHADPAPPGPLRRSRSMSGERDEGEVRALQPRAPGGADRHARPPARAASQIEQILTQLRSRQIAEEQVETYSAAGEAPRSRSASCARPRAGRASSRRSPSRRSRSRCRPTRARPSTPAPSSRRRRSRPWPRPRPRRSASSAEGEAQEDPRSSARPRPTAPPASASPRRIAIEEQVRAYGGPQFQLTQQVMSRFAEAIEKSGVDVVPKIQMTARRQGRRQPRREPPRPAALRQAERDRGSRRDGGGRSAGRDPAFRAAAQHPGREWWERGNGAAGAA